MAGINAYVPSCFRNGTTSADTDAEAEASIDGVDVGCGPLLKVRLAADS